MRHGDRGAASLDRGPNPEPLPYRGSARPVELPRRNPGCFPTHEHVGFHHQGATLCPVGRGGGPVTIRAPRADDRARTGDLHLGKVPRYQLRHIREVTTHHSTSQHVITRAPTRTRTWDPTVKSRLLWPTELRRRNGARTVFGTALLPGPATPPCDDPVGCAPGRFRHTPGLLSGRHTVANPYTYRIVVVEGLEPPASWV